MHSKSLVAFLMGVLVLAVAGGLLAQRPGQGNRGPGGKQDSNSKKPLLPNDSRLLKLHRDFVKEAERLAAEYERDGDIERARAVYIEILKLVPQYAKARNKLEEFFAKEATAEKKRFDVEADKSWQDTGVVVIKGKPIQIAVSGTWTFNMSHRVTPDGMEIPEVLKDFPLGSLIAVVVSGQEKEKEKLEPFLVGSGIQFVAKKSGKLLLRMHDSAPNDNEGKLTVNIVGTFNDTKPGAKPN